MTLQTPPSWLQAGSYPAQYDRLTAQALWATTGIIGSTSLAVTQNSPAGMSVRVASGWAAIVGTTTTNMGVYTVFNDATTVATITAADLTNPRIDLVCVTVRDAFYSGANNDVIFNVVAGTPAGSPVAPATPANSIALATVAVAANASTIVTADITDARVLVTTNIPEIGDISAVVAGTGLSGGGTSGSVTLSINTAVTADLTTAQILTNKTLTSPAINVGINTQTGTTYTLALADNGKLVTLANASPIAVTIPLNSSIALPVGAVIMMAAFGAGAVTISGAGGVTVVSGGATAASPIIRAQYSSVGAIQTSANNWLVVGDLI